MDGIDIDYLTYMCDFFGYLKRNHEGEVADMIHRGRITVARIEVLQAEYEEYLRGN